VLFEEIQFDWQTIVALFIVLIAIVVFIWQVLNSIFKSTSGCGTSCESCPSSRESNNGIKVKELIELQ
jgi:hypothetical protein